MNRILIFLLPALLICQFTNAQNWRTANFYPVEVLINHVNNSKTELSKFINLSFLENAYWINGKNKEADSCENEKIKIGKNTKDLVVKTEYYWPLIAQKAFSNNDSLRNIGYALCNELIEMGKKENSPIALSVGYSYLGWAYARDRKEEQAMNYLGKMMTSSMEMKDDSVMAEAYATYTNSYFALENYLEAYKYQLKALDIAEKINSNYLIWDYTMWLSDIYARFGEKKKSMDIRMRLLKLSSETPERYDDLAAYTHIRNGFLNVSDFESAEQYQFLSIKLSDSLQKGEYFLSAIERQFLFGLLANSETAFIEYIKKEPGAWQQYYGEIQNPITRDYLMHLKKKQEQQTDSADYYFNKYVQAGLLQPNASTRSQVIERYAAYLNNAGKYQESLDQWKQFYDLKKNQLSLQNQKEIFNTLYDLNKRTGNTADALRYHEQFVQTVDSLETLNNKNDLTLSEIKEEQKKYDTAKLEEDAKTRRRHQMQYMIITVAVISFFIFSLLLGFFRVSERTIRLLGFLAFIFLFEFLIMIADKQIHDWTHGEPAYIFLIKIGMIAVLLPLHQLIEKRVIHFLVSRKLLRLRDGRFWRLLFGDEDHLAKAD